MCPTANTRGLSSILGYTPPKYHDGKQCYVDFYAKDPVTGEMRRKKYNIDSSLPKRERRKLGAECCARILIRLQTGWTPFAELSTDRGYTKLEIVIDKYLSYIQKSARSKTIFSYTSRVNVLREYIATQPSPITFAGQFDSAFVAGFLDWVYLDREVSARTRNNYLRWLHAFSAFMLQRKYIDSNPCENISKLREDPKSRQDISPKDLQRIVEYTDKNDPYYCLACLMEYFTFIRPTELSYIKIEYLNMKKKTIFIPASVSKNRMDGYVTLNDTLIKYMLKLGIFSAPGSYYLFGRDFKPNENRKGPNHFNQRWFTLRKELDLPDSYQFYSLKDSGIRDLANATGVVNARDQARHSDISTTNKYLSSSIGRAPEAAKGFKGAVDLSELTRKFDTSQP